MGVLYRYLGREIYRSVALVTAVLLALFTFFAVIEELDSVGRSGFGITRLVVMQSLALPTRLYDFLPIAVLIGGILALSSLAQRSEITVMRAAGMGALGMLRRLAVVSLPLMIIAAGIGEWLAPAAEIRLAEARLAQGEGSNQANLLRSGYWFRESLPSSNGTRYVNIGRLGLNGNVERVVLYELDGQSHLRRIVQAASGRYASTPGPQALELRTVINHQFSAPEALPDPASALQTPMSQITRHPKLMLNTQLTPALLIGRVLTPERMSLSALNSYLSYLDQTGQSAQRHQTALWRKAVYPFTLFVMLCIASPLGWVHPRQGAVGTKIFTGVLIGVAYHMLNQLALSVGLIYGIDPWWTALGPPLLMLLLALGALFWLERRVRWR